MKLLVASVDCPAPPDNGHRLRSYALLRALAALGHETTLLALTRREERADRVALARYCVAVKLFAAAPPPSRLASLPARDPYGRRRYHQAEMAAALERAGQRSDALILDTLYAAANASGAAAEQPPLILHAHNVEHLLPARFASVSANPAARIYARHEAARLKRWERDVASQCRQVWACSAADAAAFRALAPATPVHVTPNVLDLATYAPSPEGDPNLLLIAGGLDWLPNRDALEVCLRAIWPRLCRARPSLRLLVAGRPGPARRFGRGRHGAGVTFRHDVADMRPLFSAAAACVVPLRIGSGTRFKILEAAALARPVVSTALGAEGLGFAPGREILIADEPGDFAAGVLWLLENTEARRAIAVAARRHVLLAHGLDALTEALSGALAALGCEPVARGIAR